MSDKDILQLPDLHASKVSTFVKCPHRAASEYFYGRDIKKRREKERHVGAMVGDLVHNHLTGHEPTTSYRVQYDEHTRSSKEAVFHAGILTGKIEAFLKRNQMEIVDSELELRYKLNFADKFHIDVVGSIDAIVRNHHGEHILLDLKSGSTPPETVFIQLACYALLVRHYINSMGDQTPEHLKNIKYIGYIFASRKRNVITRPDEGLDAKFRAFDYYHSMGNEYIRNALTTINQYNEVRHKVLYSPSLMNCYACTIESCAFNINNQTNEVSL